MLTLDKNPKWIKTYGGKRLVKFIYGINNSYDNGEETVGGVAIDAGVAELILLLNQGGYFTEFHCSGLRQDHAYKDEKKYGFLGGYIYFQEPKKVKKLIKYLPKSMEFRGGGFYFINHWNTPDGARKRGWDELYGNIKEAV